MGKASMEPRLVRRGNSIHGCLLTLIQMGFNGATSRKTWKREEGSREEGTIQASMEPRLVRRGNLPDNRLLHGDGRASMEPRLVRRGNVLLALIAEERINASMEPRLVRRGNLHATGLYPPWWEGLQWSHVS